MTMTYRALAKAVVGACDMIVGVSQASCDMVHELDPPGKTPIRLVYNAVEPRFFERVQPSHDGFDKGPNIGAFGVLEPRKGHAHLIRACAALSDRWPTLQLWIVGGPSLEHYAHCRADLETLARDLGLAERVHFTGRRHDVPELMARMDVVVSASVCSESLPTVLIEAAALGVPVVGTDVGGAREIIRHGETGLITHPGAPAELARNLEIVLSGRGRSMAEHARIEALRRFSPARFAADLDDCYRELTWPRGERQP
jgi:glycosyltransferase involved in cell wall biosynthesis